SGSDKNGMSPGLWSGGIQGIPDKNDILDMMVHVRRAGPNTTDSLWMFGGLSLDNTTGNRYFDFEMYQTDVYYDRASSKWYGYGPDAGHTSWKFDAAGNMITPGDIIFSAEYQSSSLTNIEARIWVKKTDWQTVTPTLFSWGGLFDGDGTGAAYGYASIVPKTAGAFYTGLQCGNAEWSGPFRLVLQNNALSTTYTAKQFMEFSVNLTKLGLDPVTAIGGDICGTPFNRIVVKTRASASFTSELKDFIGPTDLFLAARVNVDTEIPILCPVNSISNIYVSNPVSTSTYTWTTPNGRIVGSTTGPSINVDTAGTYIVTQRLQAGCSPYATDTISIAEFSYCEILDNNLIDFNGSFNNQMTHLSWTILHNDLTKSFVIERSTDGINFSPIEQVAAKPSHSERVTYFYDDPLEGMTYRNVYYKIRIVDITSKDKYSSVIKILITNATKNGISIIPNPVKDIMQLSITAKDDGKAQVYIYDQMGKIIRAVVVPVMKGNNVITLNDLAGKPRGIYQAVVKLGNEFFTHRLLLSR
ncbi:MAG: T9SS type A sorting domain-containing protein, partial [Bacteroidota bacterium]